MEEFILANNLVILNDGAPTRIGYGSESVIDLSICSPAISLNMNWTVLDTPLDSDHCPIIIKLPDSQFQSPAPSWNIKKANWTLFYNCPVWNDLPNIQGDNEALIEDFYDRLL